MHVEEVTFFWNHWLIDLSNFYLSGVYKTLNFNYCSILTDLITMLGVLNYESSYCCSATCTNGAQYISQIADKSFLFLCCS
uniref:Uncharacterized protein n=1 Tax=Monopterus albus TaxID=43700 RepID=A0A3Q3R5Q3_MONAL